MERLQRLGLHSFHRRRLRTDLITTFKIFAGLLYVGPGLFMLNLQRRGSWLPSIQLLLSLFSRKNWRKFPQKSFPIFPIDQRPISPIPQPLSPPSPAYLVLTVTISICVNMSSSGPLWPNSYHYKLESCRDPCPLTSKRA